jgi:hypothetical protein
VLELRPTKALLFIILSMPAIRFLLGLAIHLSEKNCTRVMAHPTA